MWYTGNTIKPFISLNHVNPEHTNFMHDLGYFEIPLAFKPTFLNIGMTYDLFQISDILMGNSWNFTLLHAIFGANLNFDYLIHRHVSVDHENNSVWHPKSKKNKLFSMVYSHFSQNAGPLVPWDGWENLWHLKIAPRVKHFIWLLLHNGVKTHEYPYRLNLGPRTLCGFCNLDYETANVFFTIALKLKPFGV